MKRIPDDEKKNKTKKVYKNKILLYVWPRFSSKIQHIFYVVPASDYIYFSFKACWIKVGEGERMFTIQPTPLCLLSQSRR